jgi:AAA15 family ATPase/GTPase
MIRSIEIKGLRGIKEGKLDDLTPLVILVGPNGSGKSTILEAALLGGSPRPGRAFDYLKNERLWQKTGSRWLLWRGDEHASAEIIITTDIKDTTRYVKIESTPSGTSDLYQIQFYLSSTRPDLETITVGGISDNGSSLNSEIRPLEGVTDIHIIETTEHVHQASLPDLYTETVQQGRKSQVREIVLQLLPGLTDLSIGSKDNQPFLLAEHADYAIPTSSAGEGFNAIIRLALELASRADGTVLLEEPEVYQHPAAIRQSAKAILAAVRRDIQVILTTHSLELIDALITETQDEAELNKLSVYRTQLQDGCLRVNRLSGSDASFKRVEIEDDLR